LPELTRLNITGRGYLAGDVEGSNATKKPDGYAHGVGAGTAQGPSTSTVEKSAGPTTSRYSMSGE
jgi:hypothetical protein